MNTYESVIIVPSNLSQEELEGLTNELKTLFASCGTQEPELVKLEKKRFSHPIKKKRDGYYIILRFKSHPEVLEKIQGSIRHKETILRSGFFKLSPNYKEKGEH